MALVSTYTLPMLLELEAAGKLNAATLITHGLMLIQTFVFELSTNFFHRLQVRRYRESVRCLRTC